MGSVLQLQTLNPERIEINLQMWAKGETKKMTCEAVSYQESVLNPRSSLAVMGASVQGLSVETGMLNDLVKVHQQAETSAQVQHVLTYEQDSKSIKVLLSETHSERDVLYAYVHGFHFRELMRADDGSTLDIPDMASKALKQTEGMFSEFYETLKGNGWDMTKMLIPRKEWRVSFGTNTKKEN